MLGTVKQAGKLGTICRQLDRNNIQILGISESNWNDSGSFTTIDNNLVIYSGRALDTAKELQSYSPKK